MKKLTCIGFIVLSIQGFSQSLTRSVIGSLNSSQTSSTATLHSSFGQSSAAGTLTATNTILRQGFQQPIIDLPMSVETENQPEINISPNPFTDFTSIEIQADNLSEYKLTLTNIHGVVIWEQLKVSELTRLNKNNLSAGIYILSLSKEDQVTYKKILIQ